MVAFSRWPLAVLFVVVPLPSDYCSLCHPRQLDEHGAGIMNLVALLIAPPSVFTKKKKTRRKHFFVDVEVFIVDVDVLYEKI